MKLEVKLISLSKDLYIEIKINNYFSPLQDLFQ